MVTVIMEFAPLRADGIFHCLSQLGEGTLLVRPYAQDIMPEVSKVERLILSGGPGHAADYLKDKSLQSSFGFIQEVIASGKPILGICLGHQILALHLGGKVGTGVQRCGWQNIQILPSSSSVDSIWEGCKEVFPVFHYNQDEVTQLPLNAVLTATSECCEVESFHLAPSVWAIQCHPEISLRHGQEILATSQISAGERLDLGEIPAEYPASCLRLFENFCRLS